MDLRKAKTHGRAPMPASSAGHFALGTHSAEIAAAIRDFLDRTTRLSSGNA